MNKKVLTVCGSPGHWNPGESQPYEEALRQAGVEPVLVWPDSFPWPGGVLPDSVSGLLLMGGCDVNPSRYGQTPHPETQPPDDARDELECLLIEEALARDLPLLAICRGIQILNVQHGGSLAQHIDATALHRQRPLNRGLPAHRVRIAPGTLLAKIAGPHTVLDVNSRHHQAIDRLGDGLQIAARAMEDGMIEAVERPDRRFVAGVQWHPENQCASDPAQYKLFQTFADAL